MADATLPPRTSYVKSRNAHIAYQVFGDGVYLVYVPGGWHHIEIRWEEPTVAESFRRMSRFARVATFDRHGCGLSDRSGPLPSLQEQVDDVLAVMDAAGMERAILDGDLDGGTLALLVAYMHPDRVTSLILESTTARVLRAPDYPAGFSDEDWASLADMIDRVSIGELVDLLAPSRTDDPRFVSWFTKHWLHGCGPGGVKALMQQMAEVDLRSLLPDITVPALVLQREGSRFISVEAAKYLAEHLPDARLQLLSGSDLVFAAGETDAFIDAIEEFVTGVEAQRPVQRALKTVLFTDIVGSTRAAADLGDRRWREILETHGDVTKRKVASFGGDFVGSTGDGLLATFDDPYDAVMCALDLVQSVRKIGVEIRAGLHTGRSSYWAATSGACRSTSVRESPPRPKVGACSCRARHATSCGGPTWSSRRSGPTCSRGSPTRGSSTRLTPDKAQRLSGYVP
jgi:pimeloyl-ACP methyl ester carboxylesterase